MSPKKKAAKAKDTTEKKRKPASAKSTTVAEKRISKTAVHRPTQDEVANRAYEHFVARGCAHGHDREDWLRAEAELIKRWTGR
jgi:hypothetical protein